MRIEPETSDRPILELLAHGGGQSIAELVVHMRVTATAVRQRLQRLMAAGFVDRERSDGARGRPAHRYRLTDLGRRELGSNFTDLAVVLWDEVRAITDPNVRRGLLGRITERLAGLYRGVVSGCTLEERMRSVASLLAERRVRFDVEHDEGLPVLKALTCPYTELAERDRSVCAMEKMMLTSLVGQSLRLSQCRLDGDSCCTFQVAGDVADSPSLTGNPTTSNPITAIGTEVLS
ncbi:MAG TPA: MarR family transcriptional regulator [Pirellulaceae bacterium]